MKTLNARARSGEFAASGTTDLLNQPGTFMMIPVGELKIDTEYQRPLSGARVDRYSKAWSWVACGAIIVALRGPGSGQYYVIDGQHRVKTAERLGIAELPCLVFESIDHQDEAQGFLETNTARRPMSVVDRYRALLVVEDPTALRVAEHLKTAGREASTQTNGNWSATRVSCIDTLMTAVQQNDETFTRIWPLVVDLCEGRLITKKLIAGMFYLERYLTNTSLMERHWRRRLMTIGYDGLSKSIDETIAFEGRYGSAVAANGILRAVNRGLRNKLQLTVTSNETPTEDQV